MVLNRLCDMLAQATPTAETAMFYFQTNALGFTPEFLGRVRLAGAVASLAGVGVYNFALKDVPLRKMFLYTALLGTALGMTQIMLITGPFSLICIQPGRQLVLGSISFQERTRTAETVCC